MPSSGGAEAPLVPRGHSALRVVLAQVTAGANWQLKRHQAAIEAWRSSAPRVGTAFESVPWNSLMEHLRTLSEVRLEMFFFSFPSVKLVNEVQKVGKSHFLKK